ncbi:TIGR00341 family protein [bacterium]|nr:TIGR00341 family protein [bacterium]
MKKSERKSDYIFSFSVSQKTLNEVRDNIQNSAALSSIQLLMNGLSAIIASYGLLANNPAIIIGAMVVSTLIWPILGMSLAIIEARMRLLRVSLLSLISNLIVVLGISYLLGLIHKNFSLTNEILSRTSPNLMDLIVALASGFAGALSLLSPRIGTALVGVAVATALVPPLCASGILLARGLLGPAWGAFLLATANIVGIHFASAIALWFSGFRGRRRMAEEGVWGMLFRFSSSLIIFLLMAVILTLNLKSMLDKRVFETKLHQVLEKGISSLKGSYLSSVRIEDIGDRIKVYAVVRGPQRPTPSFVSDLEKKLPRPYNGKKIQLEIRYVPITIVDSKGYHYERKAPEIISVPVWGRYWIFFPRMPSPEE